MDALIGMIESGKIVRGALGRISLDLGGKRILHRDDAARHVLDFALICLLPAFADGPCCHYVIHDVAGLHGTYGIGAEES